MTRAIVRTCLQYRYLLVTVAAVAMVVGVARLREMPVDVLPEYAPPYVEVQTESLGLSADEVESLVTLNLEELLQGVPWLKTMRSESVPGLSSIVLIFEPGTDIYRARQAVQERLTLAHMIPNVSSSPAVLQPLSATSRVMVIGLSSKDVSPIQMSVLARWKIRPALMSLPGVANVSIWGQRERQLQVRVDPQVLRANGVTLDQVVRTTGDALWVSPLSFLLSSTPGTGGWIDTAQQRLEVRHVLPIASPEDLAKVPVYGSTRKLGEVAEVVEDHQPLIGDAVRDGDPGLVLVVEKFPGANTLEVTRGLEATLAAMLPGLKGIEVDTTVLRPATFIELAMSDLAATLLVGAGLVALVLLALLRGFRVVAISLTAMVLSLTAAALLLQARGATLNAMTLAGLMVALVVIVDDAVADPVRIARGLRRSGEATSRLALSDVLEASLTVRRPLVFATLILLLAVLPVFVLTGISGAIWQPLAISYALAVAASLAVALTVTPALAAILLPAAVRRGSPAVVRLESGYRRLLEPVVRARRPARLLLAALVLAVLAGVPFLGVQSVLPSLQERALVIDLEGMPGASHPEMTRITTEIGRELRAVPGVANVGGHVGRALLGDEIVGINAAKLYVTIAPDADLAATIAAIQEVMDHYPGHAHGMHGYVEKTLKEALAGSTGDMVVRIFGPEWSSIQSTAADVTAALSSIDGVVDLRSEPLVVEPSVEVEVDLANAQRYGVKPGDVRRAAATLVNGFNVGLLFEEQKIFDVVVWSAPEIRDSLSDLRELLIDTPNGRHVRLEDVADVRVAPELNTVRREAVSRRLDVSFNVRGRELAAVARDVEGALRTLRFPFEHHAELLGEYAERQSDERRVLVAGLIATMGIFLVLQAAFQSWRLAALAFLTLPLALGGALLAAALVGRGVLSVGSLVGLLAVLALATRHVVVLIDRFRRLEEDGEALGTGLVMRGARERLGSSLVSLAAIAAGLLPVALAGAIAGLEIWHPMAVVILGGLVTTCVLEFFLVPALYLAFAPRPSPRSVPAVTASELP